MVHYSEYVLKNIRLESGFVYNDAGQVQSTQTQIAHMHMLNGRIAQVFWDALPACHQHLPKIDGQGALALPGIHDAHIHLDKTYYGGPWLAAEENKTVAQMIEIEKKLLTQQLPVMAQRAKAILDLIISKGATSTLAHCNVDRSIGIEHFINTQAILAEYQHQITAKIAAFPQHGLFRDDAVPLMKEVLSMGCDYVGGLDPNAIDGDLQRSLETTVQLALDYNAGIDIHLHERNDAGKQTLQALFKLLEQNPELRHRVHVSHAFVLHDIHRDGELGEYAARMQALGVKLITGVPIQFKMPLSELRDLGVTVEVGTDSVMDHWYPFGQGDIIERSNVIAQLYGWQSEYNLSRALYFATGKTPLSNDGKLQWPLVQDVANLTLFKASCSAEVIARIAPRRMTIHEGDVTWVQSDA